MGYSPVTPLGGEGLMARATPHITDGILSYRDGMQEHMIAVGSPMWRQWLAGATTTTFRFEHPLCNFTARRERKHDGWYSYAYRTCGGALQKAYLGKSTDLTLDSVTAGHGRVRTALHCANARCTCHWHHSHRNRWIAPWYPRWRAPRSACDDETGAPARLSSAGAPPDGPAPGRTAA
jgi:hypothetical protein